MLGEKTIETRTWYTQYRGPLLVVASKTPDRKMLEATARLARSEEDRDKYLANLQYGKAIAICRLVECRLMKKEDEEAAMCEVYNRACAWLLADIRPIYPFEVKGQLGLFEVDYQSEKIQCLKTICENLC